MNKLKKKVSRVLCILGNHELMNVLSQNFDYVTKRYANEL